MRAFNYGNRERIRAFTVAETKEEGIQVFNSNKKKEFELLAQARQKNKSF